MTCLFDAHVQVPDLKGLDCNEDVDLKKKLLAFLISVCYMCIIRTESDGEHPSYLLHRRDDDEFASILSFIIFFHAHSYQISQHAPLCLCFIGFEILALLSPCYRHTQICLSNTHYEPTWKWKGLLFSFVWNACIITKRIPSPVIKAWIQSAWGSFMEDVLHLL